MKNLKGPVWKKSWPNRDVIQALHWAVLVVIIMLQYFLPVFPTGDRDFGLVVRVLGHRSRGSDSIPGATTFSKK
jgi:hypothetical protein